MKGNQMDSAIRCGRMLLDSNKDLKRDTNAHSLLARLFERALLECKNGESSFEFSWKDIAQDSEVYDEGKKLKRHLAEAINAWSMHIEVLKEIAIDGDISHIPILELVSKGAGAGVMNRYEIRTELVDKKEVVAKNDIPEGYIRYTPELIDRPNWFGKLVNGSLAKGWVWRFLIGTLVLALGLSTLAVWIGLTRLLVQDSVFGLMQVAISTLVILLPLYLIFSPLYYCVTRRIIMAPMLMSTSVMYEAQLEFIQSKHVRADGRRIRQFRLVSYAANCQMCGDRIDVHGGNLRRWGRMTGRCQSNPEEHIYSFDHVTRLGRLIYPEYAHLAEIGHKPIQDKSGGK